LSGECVLFVGAGTVARAPGCRTGVNDRSTHRRSENHTAQAGRLLDLGSSGHRECFGPDAAGQHHHRTFGERLVATADAGHCCSCRCRCATIHDELRRSARTSFDGRQALPGHRWCSSRTSRAYWTGGGVFGRQLHGDVSCPAEIVLSRDDYDEFFERRPAMALLLESLLLNQTFSSSVRVCAIRLRQIYARIARMLPRPIGRRSPRRSRRPAKGRRFSPSSGATNSASHQNIPGVNTLEQEQQFLRFLDRLADRVTMQSHGCFLATDVEAPPRVARLAKRS